MAQNLVDQQLLLVLYPLKAVNIWRSRRRRAESHQGHRVVWRLARRWGGGGWWKLGGRGGDGQGRGGEGCGAGGEGKGVLEEGVSVDEVEEQVENNKVTKEPWSAPVVEDEVALKELEKQVEEVE